MSKIEVNTVDVASGSTLALGSSGKTISLASRKKLIGGKLTFNFNHRPQDGIISKIDIKHIKKFSKTPYRTFMRNY